MNLCVLTIVSRKNYFLLTMVLCIRKVVINNEGSNIEVDVVAEPSRVGVLNWCKNCKEESREIDCLCCQEDDAIDELKLDGKFIFFSVYLLQKFKTWLYYVFPILPHNVNGWKQE